MKKPNLEILNKLSLQDRELITTIDDIIISGNYYEAVTLINKRLSNDFNYDDYLNVLWKTKLGLFLLDAGSEGYIETAIKEGVKYLECAYLKSKIMNDGDYHYNMGNAKAGLFNITTKEPYNHIPENINYLIESKDHFWKSLRYYQTNGSEPPLELYNNLGDSLHSCYRLTEAIQMYNIVLKQIPEFPQANVNRSRCLILLNQVTNTFTPNQIMQAREGLIKALKNPELPPYWQKYCSSMIPSLAQSLIDLNIDINSLEHEKLEIEIEASRNSDYRNFCIDKKISLNEHSIYCNCAGSKFDDLSISHNRVGGNFIPDMELVLNRLKSEFIFARWLYYEFITSNSNIEDVINQDVRFIELFENEFIGSKAELIRTSFKMCFSILDRIAAAICYLFKINEPNESVSFHSFWKKYKQNERWEHIKSIENPFIISLYTLATDLNKNGQLNDYKNWRDDIEHNIMILSFKPDEKSSYILETEFFKYVDAEKFKNSLEHLLHLTASAIFNFVFCVRYEGLKLTSDNNMKPIILTPKENL